MDRKGQAALEFLMTYGWAILAAIIVIGALAYFGVFNPGRFAQESAFVSAPFTARGAIADSAIVSGYTPDTDGIKLDLLNGAGDDVTIYNITISNCNVSQQFGTGISQKNANSTIYTIVCAQGTALPAKGNAFKGDITVIYQRPDSSFTQQSSGSMTAKVR